MRLPKDFFSQDVLDLAPLLIGKTLVRNKDGIESSFMITEVEAYRGEEDLHVMQGSALPPVTALCTETEDYCTFILFTGSIGC